MTPRIKLTKEERELAISKAHEASEKIFKLVVKIISWETGPLDGAAIKKTDKITPDEWQRYRQHLLTISKSESVERVKGKLKKVYEAIKEHSGFQ